MTGGGRNSRPGLRHSFFWRDLTALIFSCVYFFPSLFPLGWRESSKYESLLSGTADKQHSRYAPRVSSALRFLALYITNLSTSAGDSTPSRCTYLRSLRSTCVFPFGGGRFSVGGEEVWLGGLSVQGWLGLSFGWGRMIYYTHIYFRLWLSKSPPLSLGGAMG